MKRVVVTAAIAATLAGWAIGPPSNAAEARLADSQTAAPGDANRQLRERTCRFQWLDPGTWTAREERRTTDCVLARWPVEGGEPKFVAVGACESGWWRFANNGGSYLGLFQHAASAWYWRVRSYMPDGWRVGPWTRWTNSRAQIVVTARMVHAGGWGPWSCA